MRGVRGGGAGATPLLEIFVIFCNGTTKEMKHVDSTEMANANADTTHSLESGHSKKRSRGDDSILNEMNLIIKQVFNTTCTICLEQMLEQNELAVMEGCSHVYHRECIEMWMKRTRTCAICRVESSALYIRASPCKAGEEKVTRKDVPRPPPTGRGERFDFTMTDGNLETVDFLLHISALARSMYIRDDDEDADADTDDDDDEDEATDAAEGDNQDSSQSTEAYTPLTRRLTTPGRIYSFNGRRSRRRRVVSRMTSYVRGGAQSQPQSVVFLLYARAPPPAPSGGAPASS
jgi:hypothetical protein